MPETVQHLIAKYKMQVGMAYLEHQNQIACTVYKNICAEYGPEVPGSKGTIYIFRERHKVLVNSRIVRLTGT